MARTNDTVRAARLPGSGHGAVGVGAAAVVIVLLAVAGVPVALLSFIGNPLPTAAPSMSWLQQPLTGTTVVHIVGVATWLLWLHLLVCLVVEVGSERGGGALAPSVPAGSVGTQPLARWLVDGIAALRPAPSAPRPRKPPAPASPVDPPGRGDREPVLNRPARTAPVPRPVDEPAVVPVGTPVKYYEVNPPSGRNFETLWDISERFLGTGLRHREILDLNRGVVQADGRTLSSLDLVQAGWMLRLPPDAEGRELRVSAPVDAATDDTAPSASPPDDHGVVRTPTVYGVEGGALAAAALGALRRRRAGGSLSWRAATTGEQPIRDEHRLRREADPARARLLEHVVRGHGATLRSRPQDDVSPPTLLRVAVDDLTATLTFDAAHAPAPGAPWSTGADGRTWTIPRADVRRLTPEGPALHPGLVMLGRTGRGAALAWDPESAAGVISLGGDDSVARGVALSWAVDTALHGWAEDRDVTLVGFADVPVAVAPGTLHRVTDIAPLLDRLEEQADAQRAACRRHGVSSVRAGRLVAPGSPDWKTHLVLLSGVPAAGTLARLDALAGREDAGISVVVVGNVGSAAVRLVAAPDGRLWNGPLGIDVRSQRLSVSAAQTLTSVFEAAREPVDAGPAALDLSDLVPAIGVSERALDPRTRYDVEIGVLGEVAVDARGPIEEERRDLLTELVVHVALHPDGATHEEITRAIWPEGVDEAVRERALHDAVAWLGRDADGAERLVVSDDGVTLRREDLRFDWDCFAALLSRAGGRAADEAAALAAALAVVRSAPWSALPAGRYAWLAAHDTDAAATTTVVLVARRLAAVCADRGDGNGARDALRTGLRIAPAAEDLWRDALRLAAALGGRRDVEAVAEEMRRSVSVHGAGLQVSERTEQVVREVLGRRAARTDVVGR